MFPCLYCNKTFTQNYQYKRHCNTNTHKKLCEEVIDVEKDITPQPTNSQKIKIRRKKMLSCDQSPLSEQFTMDNEITITAPTLIPIPPPERNETRFSLSFPENVEMTVDAIINLFRFTREHYMNLPEKGIIKTCVELLTEKLNKIPSPPFIFDTYSNNFLIYYRGKWIVENVDYIINSIQLRNEESSIGTPVLCDLIDMFIENMMLQFRRNTELHNYHTIANEIENGYRSNVQIKIVKKLAKIREN